ncbi:MAG: hypothetical protein RQ745_07350 [Longimicrobiales bacterium]|nr:hypothetical protein [Longimicrobiales bacterium]
MGPRRPTSTEERHDRRTARYRKRLRRQRLAYRIAVVGIATAAAVGIGYLLGEQARVDPHGSREGAREQMTTEELINSELNRVLLELWKMEELERR